jgi:hypothetical protein
MFKIKLGVLLGEHLSKWNILCTIAYAIKGQRVTDYFSPSNTQPIWTPHDLQGALTIDIKLIQ